ncbi:hypothetical protein GCM10027271_03340 [Saccharopolyspora gloriosae]|uniref:Uncharacterized protein YukE n=1 Tax=Saccharopolyspora gloriosae TaxID=455344 RepID=A0A840NJZ1_9PSEU|nr:hypothetical protein [Saccharopolyspora gloriosae]MBB5071884.1 uncharacterized protein YukE [Saccharopolyspora gloriosae]
MSTPDVQADPASGGQAPLGDGTSVPGDVQPQPDQQPPPPAGPPLESTAQILATGNPQQFYADGQRFDQIAGRLRGLSDGFRSELRRVEQSWRGPGAELFQDAAQKITQSIERLIDTISAPAYSSVMNQLGDALAEAQRQVNDVQTQRQQGRDALAANPAAAGDPAAQANQQQQETAQGEHANQVLQQLALTYQNLGSQLRVLPSRNSSGGAANDGGSGASARSAGTMSTGGPATMDSSGTAGTMMAPMSVGTTTRMSGDGSVLGRESAGTWGAPSADDSVVESAGLTDSGVLAPQSGSAAPMMGAFGATGAAGFGGAASQAKRRSTSSGGSGASGDSGAGEMTTFGMPASIGGGERATTSSSDGERGGRPSTESLFEQRRQHWAETLGQPGTDETTGEAGRTAEATAFGSGEAAVPGLPPGTTGGPAVPPGAPAPGLEGTHPAAHAPATGSASAGSAGTAGGPSAKLPSLPNVTGGLPATSGLSASPSLPGSTSLPGVETAGASVPNGASSAVPRGVPGAGMPGGVPGAAGGGMGSPMMPPMAGMGAGMGGALGSRGNQDRDRNTLQQEDEDVWDATDGLSGGVLGRD